MAFFYLEIGNFNEKNLEGKQITIINKDEKIFIDFKMCFYLCSACSRTVSTGQTGLDRP